MSVLLSISLSLSLSMVFFHFHSCFFFVILSVRAGNIDVGYSSLVPAANAKQRSRKVNKATAVAVATVQATGAR